MGITADSWQNYDFHVFYPFHDGSGHEGTIRDIEFVTADIGFVAIEIFDGQGAICQTIDGGQNWEVVLWSSRAFFAIDFPTSDASQIGYAAGTSGVFARTQDGGLTWDSLEIPTTATLRGISFVEQTTGWAVGDVGNIFHTTDGGESWTEQESQTTINLNAVSFASADTGYVAGDNGTILFTGNGGEGTPNNPPGEFVRVHPEDSSIVYADEISLIWTMSEDPDGDLVEYVVHLWSDPSGGDLGDTTIITFDTLAVITVPSDSIFYFHWTVHATAEGDTVEATNGEGNFEALWFNAADDSFILSPSSFSLSVFPNPFNPTTTLNLSLPVSSEAVLRVFDVSGRLVREMGLGRLQSGNHAIVFNGSELPSGIYVAAVETPTARVVQKLVLMK